WLASLRPRGRWSRRSWLAPARGPRRSRHPLRRSLPRSAPTSDDIAFARMLESSSLPPRSFGVALRAAPRARASGGGSCEAVKPGRVPGARLREPTPPRHFYPHAIWTASEALEPDVVIHPAAGLAAGRAVPCLDDTGVAPLQHATV